MEKLSKFLFKTRSNLYDFVLFGSAEDLNKFWKEEGRLLLQYPCINAEHKVCFIVVLLKGL